MGPPGRCSRELGMKWWVVLELVGADETVGIHEISGGAAVAEYAPQMIGLTLTDGKQMLAAVQRHLVRAQTADHCCSRRRCQRCGASGRSKISALAFDVAVRHGGGLRAAFYPVSVCGNLPPDAQPGC